MRTFISALALTLILVFVSSSQPSKKINSIELWRAQNLSKQLSPKQRIYGNDFFPEDSPDVKYGRIGLSAIIDQDICESHYELQNFIETKSNSSGGYILGRGDRFSGDPLDKHFVKVVRDNAFYHGNGLAQKYTIWLHIKKITELSHPSNDLITFHVRNYNGEGNFSQYWHHSYKCNELPLNQWNWYRFDVDLYLQDNNAEFALEWHGGNGDGMVRISHIAYTTEFYTYLFPDTSEVPSGTGWNEFVNVVESELKNGKSLADLYVGEASEYGWWTTHIINKQLNLKYPSKSIE